MGSRANGIVICDGETIAYYSHYAAEHMPESVLRGPDYMRSWIEGWRECPAGSLMNDIWAEADVVLDVDRSLMAFFVSGTLGGCAPLLRRFMKHAQHAYSGFTLQYAHGGVREIAAIAGLPNPASEEEVSVSSPDWKRLSHNRGRKRFFCSVRQSNLIASVTLHGGDTRIFGLAGFDLWDALKYGASPFFSCKRYRGKQRVRFPEEPWRFPGGGVHVDWNHGTMDYWCTGIHGPGRDVINAAWKGWQVTWHRDNYEAQFEKCGGMIEIPEYSEDVLQELLNELVFGGRAPDGMVWKS